MEDRNAEWITMMSGSVPDHAPDPRGGDPQGGLAGSPVGRDRASLEKKMHGRKDLLSQKCDTFQENDA